MTKTFLFLHYIYIYITQKSTSGLNHLLTAEEEAMAESQQRREKRPTQKKGTLLQKTFKRETKHGRYANPRF
jgi:hypothetical protein